MAHVDAEAAGRKDKTSEQIANDFLTLFAKLAARFGIAVDKRDEVSVEWPSGSGWQIIKELIDFFNGEAEQLILSARLPTGGGPDSQGSYARSETEEDSTTALIQGDQDILDESLTQHLIGWFNYENWNNLTALGVTGSREPKFKSSDELRRDPKEFGESVRTAIELGADVRSDEFYDGLGLTPPENVPSVIKGREAVAAGSPFAGPSFEPNIPGGDDDEQR